MGKGRGGKVARKGTVPPLPQRYEGELLDIECRYKREEAFLAKRAEIFAKKAGRRRASKTAPGEPSLAGREVGNTTKLIETILQHVDLKTILIAANRVSTTWYLTIYNSKPLQEKLFIKPISKGDVKPDGVTIEEGSGHADGRVFNPILVDKFGPVFFDFGPNSAQFRRAEAFFTMPWCAKPHEIHTYRGKDDGHGRPRIQPPKYGSYSLGVQGRAEATESRQRFTRLGASWRRMLLTQPPPPKMGFLLYSHDDPIKMKPDEDGNKRVKQHEFFIGSRPWRVKTKVELKLDANAAAVADGQQKPETEEDTVQGRIDGARMGNVYDVISVIGGQSAKQGRFWRMLWTRPKTVTLSDSLSKVRSRMLDASGFIIEMHDDDFRRHKIYGPDPTTAQEFNSLFLCEDTWWEHIPSPDVTKSTTIVTGGKGEGLDKACHHAILASSYPWTGGVILLPKNKLSPFDNHVFPHRLTQISRLFRQEDNHEDSAKEPWLTDEK